MLKKKGFTLVEVIVAAFITIIVLIGVYKLFIGGSRTADKGQWINGQVEQLRNALNRLSKEIETSTYPTTLFKDKIYDPCDNPDLKVAEKYYMRVLEKDTPIKVPESGELKIMEWFVCKAEKPGPGSDSDGKLTKNQLYLEFKNKLSSSITGNLVLKSETFNYTTNANSGYAKSGKLNLTSINNSKKTLVEDVEWVEFSGLFPSNKNNRKKHLDFPAISVKIHTLYPKDVNVFKENFITATPQVAVDLL